jgi:hypothetical protein
MQEAKDLGKSDGDFGYFETSAQSGEGVKPLFNTPANALRRRAQGNSPGWTLAGGEFVNIKNGGCCSKKKKRKLTKSRIEGDTINF